MTCGLAILYAPNSSHASLTSLLGVGFHATFACIALWAAGPGMHGVIVALALVTRLAAALIEVYAPFSLPFMGGPDSQGFLAFGNLISADLSLAGNTYGGLYTGLLGVLFHLAGPDPLVGHYFNVLCGATSVLFLSMILGYLQVNRRLTMATLLVAALLPAAVLFTGDLLREAPIQALISASLFCFFRGFLAPAPRWLAFSFALILAASAFHAGAISLLLAYALILGFLDSESGTLSFKTWRVASAAIVGMVFIFVVLQFPELFLEKFDGVHGIEDVFARTNYRQGSASYLTGLEVTGLGSLLLYGPLRALYFVSSPLPQDWRSMLDFLAFILDSSVYIFATLMVLRIKGLSGRQKVGAAACGIILVITCLVFGLGVFNSGTAMRHRTKLLMVFLTLLATGLSAHRVRFSRYSPREPEAPL